MAQPQQVARGPILTLKYNGAAPPPHPPCLDPTPDEMFDIDTANRARQQAEKEAKESQKEEPKDTMGKIGGWLTKAANAVDGAASNAHVASEAKVRSWEHQQGEEKFTLNFPELCAAGDKFVVHYSAAVMHKGQQVAGTVFISQRNFCFVSETIKDAMAFAAVASVQRSCALKTQDNGPPFIMPIPAPHVLPNCVQFFMTDFRVIQFCDFESYSSKAASSMTGTLKGRAVDRFYNWIDHTWRAAVQVPVPGVQYAQY